MNREIGEAFFSLFTFQTGRSGRSKRGLFFFSLFTFYFFSTHRLTARIAQGLGGPVLPA